MQDVNFCFIEYIVFFINKLAESNKYVSLTLYVFIQKLKLLALSVTERFSPLVMQIFFLIVSYEVLIYNIL